MGSRRERAVPENGQWGLSGAECCASSPSISARGTLVMALPSVTPITALVGWPAQSRATRSAAGRHKTPKTSASRAVTDSPAAPSPDALAP